MTRTLANASACDRPQTDYYATPRDVTVALLERLALDDIMTIWEPAAGNGAMADVLREWGHNVVATDLSSGIDFLAADMDPVEGLDWIITNPPFSQAEAFIRRAIKIAPSSGFAFLLKSQFWHAARRLGVWGIAQPAEVLPLTWRPDFLYGKKGGAPTMDVLWSVWRAPYHRNRTTKYVPLRKPAKDEMSDDRYGDNHG